jgi:putative oxidoreductase
MSGVEFPRLLLRGVVGATMVAHGIKHARSLTGTAGWFESIGFKQPQLQAQVSAAVAVSALGAGRFSVDRLLLGDKRRMTPLTRTALTVGLGLGGAAAQLAAFWRRPVTTTAASSADS